MTKINAEARLAATEVIAMPALNPKETGLPKSIYIWISTGSGGQHGPRIKVSNLRGGFSNVDNFSVTVSDTPEIVAGEPKNFTSKELSAIYYWICLNKQVLITFWSNLVGWDNTEAKYQLKKLPK